MKKVLILLLILKSYTALADELPQKLMLAPGTVSSNSATLLWEKPADFKTTVRYHIVLNGRDVAIAEKCNYRLTGLLPGQAYNCIIKKEDGAGKLMALPGMVKFITKPQSPVINIVEFGAKGDGSTLNTKSIQKAIDACPVNGTVLIPAGKFLTGALFLKSHMTLEIAKDGILKGSIYEADYLPYINNRFEGWEMKTYASLLNAGVMDHRGGYAVEDLTIRGAGTLSGGDTPLALAMIAKNGLRCRGRLICLMNCRDVDIQGLNVQDSPCWTIHYIYCKNISCHDLNINSTAHNGDGIDPDSSDDSYIFNCSFATGDDCIAIKSGKNPQGNIIGKPTRNVHITDCTFTRGHGISIGSEISGGVSNVWVQDCKADALIHGLQIKGTKERGGYVKNVTVADCNLLQITVFSAVSYNNDGAPAPAAPFFEHFVFRNIDLSRAGLKEPVIDLNGFTAAGHQLKNCTFTNITLPQQATVSINNADSILFKAVKTIDGKSPRYTINNSRRIDY